MLATTGEKKAKPIAWLGSGCRMSRGSGSAIPMRRDLALAQMDTIIPLPECLKERLPRGELMAPTLREERRADGERFAVLDFIVEVKKAELPAWENVERVLRSRLGGAYAY